MEKISELVGYSIFGFCIGLIIIYFLYIIIKKTRTIDFKTEIKHPNPPKCPPKINKRSCYDCKYLKAYVSWWCTNDKAIKDRGTRIPGCINCPHWELEK